MAACRVAAARDRCAPLGQLLRETDGVDIAWWWALPDRDAGRRVRPEATRRRLEPEHVESARVGESDEREPVCGRQRDAHQRTRACGRKRDECGSRAPRRGVHRRSTQRALATRRAATCRAASRRRAARAPRRTLHRRLHRYCRKYSRLAERSKAVAVDVVCEWRWRGCRDRRWPPTLSSALVAAKSRWLASSGGSRGRVDVGARRRLEEMHTAVWEVGDPAQGVQGFGHRGFGQGFGHARHETRFWAPETARNYKSWNLTCKTC